jgi:outer membrane protein TolC
MRHLAFCIGVLLWAATAAAQPAAPLTLEDAIARAIEASHRLAEARAREQGALAAVEIRRAGERPTVNVTGSYTRTNHVEEFGVPQPDGRLRIIYPDIPDNYFARSSFQWPIFTFGRTDMLERAAEAEARAVAAEIDVARADLRLEVTRAYWALVTADESVSVLQGALERANAHLRDIKAMFDQGLVPPNEVSSVEAQRSRQQMQLIEAQNVRASVLEELRRLTGLPGAEITIPPLPPTLAPAPAASFGEPGALNRAERRALLERITAAEELKKAAETGRKPTIAANGGVDYANPNPRIFPRKGEWQESWDLSVNVNWPIWDGGRSKAEAAQAAAMATATRERLADLDALIALDVRQRQLDIASAKAAIAAAEDAVRSAQEARRVVDERFRVGVATNTEVLDAQVALLQAELDRTRAIANLRLAEARLDRALGR